MARQSVLERAFELARERKFGRLQDLENILEEEGYGNVRAQLSGRHLRAQLRALAGLGVKNPLA